MTYRSIADFIFRHSGLTSLDPLVDVDVNLVRRLESRDIPDAVICINGALEESYSLAPISLTGRPVGGVLRPAPAVTLTATQYSATISALTTYASWMLGCTIRITGDELDNQIISSTELLRPYVGSSAAGITATVFADCIPVDPKYMAVIEPVSILGRVPVRLVGSEEEFYAYAYGGYGRRSGNFIDGVRYGGWGYNDTLANKTTGQPRLARAEWMALGTAQPSLFLRFNPMPDRVYSVTFTGQLAPPVITAADIWTSGTPTVDPGTIVTLPFPSSVLTAFCLKRWTANPTYSPRGGDQIAEIERQFEDAKRAMLCRPAQYAEQFAIFHA